MANIISISGGSGRPKYTATVSSNMTTQYTYVRVNDTGQDYSADGSTFTWTDGDNIVFRLGTSDWDSYVYVNGERVRYSYGGYYTYTPPSKDININIAIISGARITVEITYPDKMNITENGTYNISDYESVNVSVGGVPDPVNIDDPVRFFDYDGTLLYSYTASDFQSLSAMPANPSHSGLTAQGWNWSLTDAKAQLTAMGACDIGQMYVTDDGKTRLYCHFEESKLTPYLGICPNGTVTIDWGDNTATSTLTGTSLTSAQRVQHTYASAGSYVITITPTSGTFGFYGTSNGSYVLQKTTTNSQNISNSYTNSIKKVELGTSVNLGDYSFYNCYSLESITIPNTVTSMGTYAFRYNYSLRTAIIPSNVTSIGNYTFNNCTSLEHVVIPKSVTTVGTYILQSCYSLSNIVLPSTLTNIGNQMFNSDYSLAKIILPSSVTSLGNASFSGCRSLAKITFPSSITTIGGSAFASGYGLAEIHFKPTTPPTLGDSSTFMNLQTDCKIYVPTGKLSAYTSAANYPSSSTYTYIEE